MLVTFLLEHLDISSLLHKFRLHHYIQPVCSLRIFYIECLIIEVFSWTTLWMFSLLRNELYRVGCVSWDYLLTARCHVCKFYHVTCLNLIIDSAGISLKTQELYALVFITRYLDIFDRFSSIYNSIMKLIFLGSSLSIVWYMRRHKVVRRSYDKDQDTFRHQFIILPCLLLALVINHKFTFKEVHI